MGQIFHRSTNTISRASLIGAFLFVGLFLWFIEDMQRAPWYSNRNVFHIQPVPFSHQHHVGGLGIDCRYCHTSVEVSSFAGIPPTKTCMNCHAQIWTNTPMLEPVRQSFRSGAPLIWARVNDLPDYVFFDHSIHINKGVGCDSCHGPVDRMPLVYPAKGWMMEECLDCHRAPEKYLRPREQVFNMRYQQPAGRNVVAYDGQVFTDQIKLGSYLKNKYHLRSVQDITSCWTCHR
ncbi:MAG: cytochrome c3 family protein [Terriglobales bacterium]